MAAHRLPQIEELNRDMLLQRSRFSPLAGGRFRALGCSLVGMKACGFVPGTNLKNVRNLEQHLFETTEVFSTF